MDNKDFEKISIALRDGTLNTPELLDSLDSLGEHVSLPVVLDATFHKIANTDHDFNNNKLPVNTSELPSIYADLVRETTSYLQTKVDSGDIERIDHQLYTNLNYNLGNLVARPSEIEPLINDEALAKLFVDEQMPTQLAESSYKIMNDFKHATPFLDLEDVVKTLNEKLSDFDASSTNDDIQKIILLTQKQMAFKDAQNEEGDSKGTVPNYEDYKKILEANEKMFDDFLNKAEVQKTRGIDEGALIDLLDETEKASYEEGILTMKDSIKSSQKVFDRRLSVSLLRDEIEDALNLSDEPTLIISEGPDAAKIQAQRKRDLERLEIKTEEMDWEEQFQATLRALNSRELRTYDKLRLKGKIGDPNKSSTFSNMKLLGESIIVLNELGNADRTLLNVSPLTGTMRLGRDTPVDSEQGLGALKIAALNARRKGWNNVYLNHPGRDVEAIPFIKAAIRAMVVEGKYELDQIKVPKRFQKLIENYKIENPQLTISGGNDIVNKEDYVNANELNKDVVDAPKDDKPQDAPEATPDDNQNAPKPTSDANDTPKDSDSNELVPAPTNGADDVVDVKNPEKDVVNSADDEAKQEAMNKEASKGQPALPDYMRDDAEYFDAPNSFMDDYTQSPPESEPVDLEASAVAKAMELYQHSPKLSESGSGYIHKPIFDIVKDLIKENKGSYWSSIGNLNSNDTPLASAMQEISTEYLQQGLFSPKVSEVLIKKLNSESENKLETIFAKNMGRELTTEEQKVLKEHSTKIAEYLDSFVNKGEYSLVIIDDSGMRSIKNSPEKIEDFINTAELKKTNDRNTLESINIYSEAKKEGLELFQIYDKLNLTDLTNAGCTILERMKYEEYKKLNSDTNEDNPQSKAKSSIKNTRP